MGPFFYRNTLPSFTLSEVAFYKLSLYKLSLYKLSSFCHTKRYQKPKDSNEKPWLISNLMHKILIYLHIIRLLKSSTCFEHYPAHLQEVYVVIVYMQPLVSSLSVGDCPVHRLRKNTKHVEDFNKCIIYK